MNYRMVSCILARILIVEAVLMLLPLLVSFIYSDGVAGVFLICILIELAVGFILKLPSPKDNTIFAKEGFAIVALAWIAVSLFGALPFYISGAIPNYIDCFFETVSGFTTTGSTILREIEGMQESLLFWRSFTHWVGGMGVLVFVMAVIPMSDGHGMHLLRAEVPGPTVGKLVSKMSSSAKVLYEIYFVMTVVEVILLFIGGMPLFDSFINAFGSAGTGGFACKNISIGAYDNAYFDTVIGIFMLLFGINFNLYYFILIGKAREVLKSEELRAYLIIVASSVILIAINICGMYRGIGEALRHSFFQVSSIITTTGFSTVDFNLWPSFSKGILVLLMFIGACAGSTGGGIKVARIVIMSKVVFHDISRMTHPNSISNVHFEGKALNEKTVRSLLLFLGAYILVLAASTLLLSLESFDLITTFTAVVACLNNIGPGLEVVGPMGNFADFSWAGKLLLSFDMLLGRLEIFPMLLLFYPSIWRKKRRVPSKESGFRAIKRVT